MGSWGLPSRRWVQFVDLDLLTRLFDINFDDDDEYDDEEKCEFGVPNFCNGEGSEWRLTSSP
ncbi:MAG: hypothetical protein WD873_00990, partial [Candidatus Hydrogenedentales bacterium]